LVVDQNPDDRVLRVLAPYHDRLEIRHARSSPGLSVARNEGIRQARGALLAFPDDDCWYPEGLLERVEDQLRQHPEIGALTGRLVNAAGRTDPSMRFDMRAGVVSRANVWERLCSATLFVRSRAVGMTAGFDRELGVGSGTPWESAEDIDFVTALMDLGVRVHYDPTLVVGHPTLDTLSWAERAGRVRRYGRGIGRVWRKRGFSIGYVGYRMARPLGGCLLSLITGRPAKARYHAAAFRGRWEGWTGRVPKR
jgi:glycosyltransferase involved in cell wall biosynthesis